MNNKFLIYWSGVLVVAILTTWVMASHMAPKPSLSSTTSQVVGDQTVTLAAIGQTVKPVPVSVKEPVDPVAVKMSQFLSRVELALSCFDQPSPVLEKLGKPTTSFSDKWTHFDLYWTDPPSGSMPGFEIKVTVDLYTKKVGFVGATINQGPVLNKSQYYQSLPGLLPLWRRLIKKEPRYYAGNYFGFVGNSSMFGQYYSVSVFTGDGGHGMLMNGLSSESPITVTSGDVDLSTGLVPSKTSANDIFTQTKVVRARSVAVGRQYESNMQFPVKPDGQPLPKLGQPIISTR